MRFRIDTAVRAVLDGVERATALSVDCVPLRGGRG